MLPDDNSGKFLLKSPPKLYLYFKLQMLNLKSEEIEPNQNKYERQFNKENAINGKKKGKKRKIFKLRSSKT